MKATKALHGMMVATKLIQNGELLITDNCSHLVFCFSNNCQLKIISLSKYKFRMAPFSIALRYGKWQIRQLTKMHPMDLVWR